MIVTIKPKRINNEVLAKTKRNFRKPKFGPGLPNPSRELFIHWSGHYKNVPYWAFHYYGRRIKYAHFVWNYYNKQTDPYWGNRGYIIHHKNGNSLDDHIANLQKVKAGEHSRRHHKGKFVSKATRKRIGDATRGRKLSKEHADALHNAWRGCKHTLESRKKMGKEKLGKPLSPEAKQKKSEAMKLWWERNRNSSKARSMGRNWYNTENWKNWRKL